LISSKNMLDPIIKNNSITHTTSSSNKSAKIQTPFLKQGEILRGTVVDKLKDGSFLISSKGKNFRAYSTISLNRGSNYNFQVLSTQSKIALKALGVNKGEIINPGKLLIKSGISGSRLSSLLSLIIRNPSLKNLSGKGIHLLKNLNLLLKSPLNDKMGHSKSLWVSRNINGSGVFWENKVLQYFMGKKNIHIKNLIDNDLKGLLLALGKNLKLKTENLENSGKILGSVKEAVSLIERDQIMNITTMREGLGWFVHLIGLDEDDFDSAELFIKNKTDGGSFFTIYLDMSYAGKIETVLSMIDGIIGIKIYVEGKETADVIKDNLTHLKIALSDAGVRTGNIDYEIKEITGADDIEERDFHSSVDLII